MEGTAVSESEMPAEETVEQTEMEEEEEEEEEMEMVWEILEEMVREGAEEALEEGVQELAGEMLWEVLDERTRQVVEEFYQELLDSALSSSSEATSLEECESLREEEAEAEEEFDGALTEKTLVKGLSNLRHTATGLEQAYLHLSLPNYELSDISILCDYTHLQKLELPNNNITDLSCISRMPYLLQLDVSHNALSSLADIKLPKNIKEVNFSYNQISEMKDLSDYQFLFKLNLDNNQIQAIKGLQNCRSLSHLSLAENRLLEISGLDNLPIKFLCFQGNQLTNVRGLANMKRLHKLDLSNNKIETLIGLEDHDLLETINLENNQIRDLNEIKHLRQLLLLRVLNMLQNPIQENPDYLFWILFMVQNLTELDHKKVKATEKVMAINTYNPPAEVVAAHDHMTHIMYSFLQLQKIHDSTLPNFDIPYPMLVLTGPQACGKRELAHMLCQEFSDYFGYCICHTTRNLYVGEEDGCDYHFVSEQAFEDMIRLGKFIETIKYNGHYYGLSRDALEAVAREGLACCIHMELEGVRSLKKTYLEPRYILLIPMKKEEHEKRLRLRGLYSKSQIDVAVSRVDHYISMNQEYPGYFDAVINTDDLIDAYTQLSQLLREYLSLTYQMSNDSDKAMEGDKWQTSDLAKITLSEVNELSWNKITWSGALPIEFVDSSTRNYSSRVQARLSAEKTAVEQDSIERRQKVAREAVMGRTPSASTLMFKRVRNIPARRVISPDATKSTSYTSNIPIVSNISKNRSSLSFSPVIVASSSEATHATSEDSSLSSADVFSEQGNPVELDSDSSLETGSQSLLSVKVLGISGLRKTLEGDQDSLGTLQEEKPDPCKELQSASRCLSVQTMQPPSSRLGSNIKPILPPIPSGRTTAEIPDSPKQAICTLK
ncbi:leucine-rich repeat and guanylate kinase domain-containing protein isoform X2 [Heptranchias perlo]|uniref:leucine-rich repeat and guanylate kinase domain-containing protein isoform X2 n=1 Tax=Heptranchias perlo TaxID=212740 RepID=UPI0035594127